MPSGFSFIEVLVSLLLFSFILVGFEGMELYALRETRASWYRMVAGNQLISMTERLRAWDGQSGWEREVDIWNIENKGLLPRGSGKVSGGYPTFTISLSWGKELDDCEGLSLSETGCLTETVTL